MAKADKKQYNNTEVNEVETKQSPAEVTLVALKNTFLPDGIFVKEGDKVKVAASYAEAVLAEKHSPFKKA